MARGEIPFAVEDPSTGMPPTGTISVQVNIRGGGAATVYTTEGGGTTAPNPITVPAHGSAGEGRIDGWLDEGSYDLIISGTAISTYTQPVDIIKGTTVTAFDGSRITAGTVPGSALAATTVTGSKVAAGTLTYDKLHVDVLPIGTIIPWWRPSNSHALPSGWLECDGSAVTSGNHNFTGGGTITLPDLRNQYILGADSTKAYATAPTLNDLASGAPGVNAVAGSNVLNLAHTHTISDHSHTLSHTHTIPDHSHGFTVPEHSHNIYTRLVQHWNSGEVNYGLGSYSTEGIKDPPKTGTTAGSGAFTTSGQSTATTSTASTTPSSSLSSTTDSRPKSRGLVFLIKVKNV